jgi:HK97 family phage portal protein
VGIRQRLAHWLDPPEQRSMTSWDLLKAGMAGWGISDASGQVVTHKSAEHALATVGACVQGIASAIASLPAYVYVWQGDRRVLAEGHPLQRIIDRGPNPLMTWSDWVEWTMASVLLRGNAISEIIVDGAGRLTELRPISWDLVSIVELPAARIAYDVTSDVRGGTRRLLQEQIYHLRDRSDDGRIGISRLTRAAGVIGQAQAINHFAGAMWKNGVSPSGAVTIEGKIGPEAFAQLQERWRQLYAGPEAAGRAVILDQGAKWQQIGISPENAELLMSRRFTTEELCRVFGVPPILAGIWDHASFTNSEQASRWYATHTLGPWIVKLQLEAKRSLFTAATATRHELGIDMSGLLRGDPELRWKSHEIASRAGILTVNEIRQEEGWPPLAAGDMPAAPEAST